MLLIPAIDIKSNNCVRLKKGNINNFTIFSKNPLLFINKWINYGIKRLHLVDLDGAFLGKPKNLFFIKSIINFINNRIPIQLGGGIRSLEIIEYYFDIGISYIILGTKAISDMDFFINICEKFPGKIILSLDIKNSKIAINGWKEYYKLSLIKFIKNISNFNIDSIICTDINRDGMLKGINFEILLKISKFFFKPIIASGGLKSILDIKKLFNLQKNNLLGVICGKSIYSGYLDLLNIQNKINILNNIYINND
ncbi:Phosphoribosylformimino-5-aminoimidazole carboxamide ribotide isomerase [Candidatus Nasuia deltocephalinicola]|nr:Phosphoribosylformimino-5-aminoimidazole carboxamide ribotide isomerase [Candidatus Nasuia deltocephalinicola]